MVNVVRILGWLPVVLGSEISDKVAELTTIYCSGVPDLAEIDPADADVVHLFVGENNLVDKVCNACMR